MTADSESHRVPVVLHVGRSESTCGACWKTAWPHDLAHTTPCGYDKHPGCGAVWTHVVSSYAGPASEAATRAMRPDLVYGTPDRGA